MGWMLFGENFYFKKCRVQKFQGQQFCLKNWGKSILGAREKFVVSRWWVSGSGPKLQVLYFLFCVVSYFQAPLSYKTIVVAGWPAGPSLSAELDPRLPLTEQSLTPSWSSWSKEHLFELKSIEYSQN